jgi:DNA recombination protein RmuC
MLDLIIGIAVGVAAIAGLLLGIRVGKGSARDETKALLDRIGSLEADKARLEGLVSGEGERNQLLREQIAGSKEREKAQEEKYVQMKSDVDKAFGNLAAEALRANNQSFLSIAKQELGGQTNEARLTLEAKETAIKKMIEPLEKALNGLDAQSRAMEEKRSGAYARVENLIDGMQKSIPASLDALKIETAQLVTALRAPKTRGNWGELQLKRCVEYAGMVQYCSFSEQVSTRGEDDRMLRPDMIIQLPNGREIVVDAKTPLDAFLDAGGNADPATQKLRFDAHAQRVRAHLRELSGKAYWKQFDKAPDFVVCFLPSEALFSAALEADPSLIEFSAQNNVVMATPTTLIALLRAVEFGWQQSEITENAKAIHEMGKKIYEKLVVAQVHVTRLGNAIGNSVEYYNKFLGTIEGKSGVFFYGRQLGELIHSDSELAEVKKLPPDDVRAMESQEWPQQLLAIAASDGESEAPEV